ncbi:MAG: hypothetical protein CVT74_10695 [Alphaproteobacteria bacterium HGW-Alphaproteobacteria-13]|nr:MAG: hypothetical protein CVT74_10695 [Alphaproteobacteria bacterium HGW-Alphaproteobacteria-13]
MLASVMARHWRRIGLHVKRISADDAGAAGAAGLWRKATSPFPFASSEVEMPIGRSRLRGVSTSLDTNGNQRESR